MPSIWRQSLKLAGLQTCKARNKLAWISHGRLVRTGYDVWLPGFEMTWIFRIVGSIERAYMQFLKWFYKGALLSGFGWKGSNSDDKRVNWRLWCSKKKKKKKLSTVLQLLLSQCKLMGKKNLSPSASRDAGIAQLSHSENWLISLALFPEAWYLWKETNSAYQHKKKHCSLSVHTL